MSRTEDRRPQDTEVQYRLHTTARMTLHLYKAPSVQGRRDQMRDASCGNYVLTPPRGLWPNLEPGLSQDEVNRDILETQLLYLLTQR